MDQMVWSPHAVFESQVYFYKLHKQCSFGCKNIGDGGGWGWVSSHPPELILQK